MTDIVMPSMGENVKEGVVVNVLVKPGDTISYGQILLEVETDKVTFEVPAEVLGKITEVFVQKGALVHQGELVARVEDVITESNKIADNQLPALESNHSTPETIPQPQPVQEPVLSYTNQQNGVSARNGTSKIISTPLARKLARELDIEIAEVGTAINKRVSFSDVKSFARTKIQQLNTRRQQTPFATAPPLPDFEKFGPVRRQELSALMAATSRNMIVSARIIPHAWVQEKVDITDLEAKRKQHKQQVEQAGGSLTITALVVKAVAHALKAFPLVNSSLDTEKNELIIKDHIHIGVAVDTDRGLLVPVIRDADQRNLTAIAVALTRISKETKERKTKLDDLEGATFTISNLGGIGTTGINPLVNWPQVAILGLSASQIEPVWLDNQFIPRLRLPLTLGFDHRVVNGADAARFLHYLKKILEDPFLLLL